MQLPTTNVSLCPYCKEISIDPEEDTTLGISRYIKCTKCGRWHLYNPNLHINSMSPRSQVEASEDSPKIKTV